MSGSSPTIGILIYQPGGVQKFRGRGLRIHTDLGVTGEYFGGFEADYAVIGGLAHTLIGRNALERDAIYDDLKQATRQQSRMGMGVVDIALWDLAGKYYDAPIYELLGGSAGKKLPCYASTYVGDTEEGGLDSPEAYADFAEACLELGYPGFKIHGWQDAPAEGPDRAGPGRGPESGGQDGSDAGSLLRHQDLRRRPETGPGLRRV